MVKRKIELAIGPVKLNRLRVVVAVGYGVERNEVQAALAQGADIVEVRVDLFPHKHVEDVLEELKWYDGMPLLGTVRSAAEGGKWKGSEAQRLAMFEAIAPHVHALDIELGAKDIVKEVIKLARKHKLAVIGSFHDFEKTPTDRVLKSKVALAKSLKVDILKIAAQCNDNSDVLRLARFTMEQSSPPTVVVGMGELGALTRVFFPALGSRLAYTFVGEPTAPGQLTCGQTLEYLSAFYPEQKA